MNPQRPQRPVGVLLSALALGLAALFLILFAFGSLFTALGGGQAFASAAGSAPSAAIAAVGMFVMAFVYFVLAGWSIATLVGLVRMQSWARVSAMLIAGGLALLGLLSAFAMLGFRSLMNAGNAPLPANIPPAFLHRVVAVMIAVSLLLAILCIAWLIYLAGRRTREAFAQAALQTASSLPAWPQQPGLTYPQAPSTAWQSQPQPDPLTDFTVARPLTPVPPPAQAPEWQSTQPSPELQPQPAPWPVIPVPPHTRIRTGRPISITILAIFALISAVVSLFGLVSPFPAFLFGYALSGWPVHLYSLLWATGAAIAGLGMLRLQRPAWVLSFVLLGVSALNALAMLLPAGRARYAAYILSMQQNSPFGNHTTPLPAGIMAASMALGMLFGLALMVFCAILLWRARWAFEPTTPPPATGPSEL